MFGFFQPSIWGVNRFEAYIYTPKTNMAMEKQPFEDVSPIKNGDVPLPFMSFPGVYVCILHIGDLFLNTRIF